MKGKRMRKKHILTSLFTIWLFVPVVGYAVQIGDGPFEAQPGYYWHYDGNDLNPEECPSGYYCEGFSNEYFQGDSIGATLCTDTVPDYPLSDPGASRWYQCYTTVNSGNSCSYYNNFSDDNLNPTFSTNYAVFRNYPEGEQALEDCMVTSLSCPGGAQATPNGLLTPYIFKDVPLTANPYVFWVSIDGSTGSGDSAYNQGDHTAPEGNYRTITDGSWEVRWSDGIVVGGVSSCVYDGGAFGQEIDRDNYAPNDMTGNECICRMEYTNVSTDPDSGNHDWIMLYEPQNEYNDPQIDCITYCPRECTRLLGRLRDPGNMQETFIARKELFGAAGYVMSDCPVSTVNVTWYHLNNTVHERNTCTYGGTVTFPNTPTRKGYRFNGWNILNN